MDETEAMLEDLELRINRLKILYEQYFLGMEKAEPVIARKEALRILQALLHTQIRNTALRFRFNNLKQRWNTYVTRWGRTLREIEQGTYSRHVARARRKGIRLPDELEVRLHHHEHRHEQPLEASRRSEAALWNDPLPADEFEHADATAPGVTRFEEDPLHGLLDEVDDRGGRFVFESRSPPAVTRHRRPPRRCAPPHPRPPRRRRPALRRRLRRFRQRRAQAARLRARRRSARRPCPA
jgi:hypothetical protein